MSNVIRLDRAAGRPAPRATADSGVALGALGHGIFATADMFGRPSITRAVLVAAMQALKQRPGRRLPA